jgi:hypothetical protein
MVVVDLPWSIIYTANKKAPEGAFGFCDPAV